MPSLSDELLRDDRWSNLDPLSQRLLLHAEQQESRGVPLGHDGVWVFSLAHAARVLDMPVRLISQLIDGLQRARVITALLMFDAQRGVDHAHCYWAVAVRPSRGPARDIPLATARDLMLRLRAELHTHHFAGAPA